MKPPFWWELPDLNAGRQIAIVSTAVCVQKWQHVFKPLDKVVNPPVASMSNPIRLLDLECSQADSVREKSECFPEGRQAITGAVIDLSVTQ